MKKTFGDPGFAHHAHQSYIQIGLTRTFRIFKKVMLDLSVTFLFPQIVATASMAKARFPVPITNHAVKVIGEQYVPLKLHCERHNGIQDGSCFLDWHFLTTLLDLQ